MKIYDADIRKILFNSFLKEKDYIEGPDTIVINELDVCAGASRVDIAVINGKIHGYEIKSKQDNLERLPSQIESYNSIFDTMTIVTYKSHLNKIKTIVPRWWGIKYIDDKNGNIILKNVRKAKENSNIIIQNVAMLLWKDEMIDLLSNFSDVNASFRDRTRYDLSYMIQQYVDSNTVKNYVRNTLKSRENWKAVPLVK